MGNGNKETKRSEHLTSMCGAKQLETQHRGTWTRTKEDKKEVSERNTEPKTMNGKHLHLRDTYR